ncbi:ankyrin repeat protein [Stylonychia lemnae]|uniref:Ankyrin repeat protein n=1 Tax=Stylonychia lemnae TaxID=5949 RepID=A0A078ABX5_STYLE|nr:ankyrin repeat protein [Stylonychia lemnae]|eukprot:CDW79092.1 ankyrin repeat protein [Stylonychia lemnae]
MQDFGLTGFSNKTGIKSEKQVKSQSNANRKTVIMLRSKIKVSCLFIDTNAFNSIEIKRRIEDAYLINNKWSYIIDVSGICLKYYIKPASVMVDVADEEQMKFDNLIVTLIDCMKAGKWLTFNFKEEEGTKILRHTGINKIPAAILNPLEIYCEQTLDILSNHVATISKNDNFRLIFISKSVLIPKQFKDNFEFHIIDDQKVQEQDLEDLYKRREPDKGIANKMGIDLIEAAYNGEFEKVKELISNGADPKFKDYEGNNCFTEACLMGHYDMVVFLLSLDLVTFDVNYMNNKNRTPLHKAAFGGHHQIVLLLLENGANPKINDLALAQPIDYASNKKTHKILKLWDIERTKQYWEKHGSKKNQPVFYDYLDLDFEEREKIRYQVCDYAQKGKFSEIEKIILQGHASGWTPLIIASFHGYTKIVALLIANRADPNILTNRQESAIDVSKYPDIRKMLKDYEISWNREAFDKMIDEKLTTIDQINTEDHIEETIDEPKKNETIEQTNQTKADTINHKDQAQISIDNMFDKSKEMSKISSYSDVVIQQEFLNQQSGDTLLPIIPAPKIISRRDQFFDEKKLNESYSKRGLLPTIDQKIQGSIPDDPQVITAKLKQKLNLNKVNAKHHHHPHMYAHSNKSSPRLDKFDMKRNHQTLSTNVSNVNSPIQFKSDGESEIEEDSIQDFSINIELNKVKNTSKSTLQKKINEKNPKSKSTIQNYKNLASNKQSSPLFPPIARNKR